MKRQLLLIALMALGLAMNAQQYTYEVPETPWEESFGNHRTLIKVNKSAEVVSLDFLWRRADNGIHESRFLIVHAETGDTISNILRQDITNERCQLLFGPAEKGNYYFYYLPYKVQYENGFCRGGYLKPEETPSKDWSAKAKETRKPTKAQVLKIQARTDFNSFYPMEVIATEKERKQYATKHTSPFLLFPEDRSNPIRMRNHLPVHWLKMKQGQAFHGTAAPNEYYAFQIGVWASTKDINSISYHASDLKCGNHTIPASSITCFNLEGVNPYGQAFKKELSITQGNIQALWFGVDVTESQPAGTYKGEIRISDNEGYEKNVPIQLEVKGSMIADRGDNEPWRHSRLRWLNSTLGIADTPTLPYTAMATDENVISCFGRNVTIDMQTGTPAQISAWNTDILAAPIRFIIETEDGIKSLKAEPTLMEQTEGHVSGSWMAEDEDLQLSCQQTMEFDGWINYVYTVLPKKDLKVKDIRLEIPMKKEVGTHFMGIGLAGQNTPLEYQGKWDTPEKTIDHLGGSIATGKQQNWWWPFDSFWVGNQHAGLHCEFRGSTYSGPLINVYRPAYPESWHNNGKGGFKILASDSQVLATAYSGERLLETNQPLLFDYAMLVTPVKELNTHSQFTNRYYHNGYAPKPSDEDIKTGVRIINVHHANEYNPFINYPFLSYDKMRGLIDEMHEKGCKVKLYYTLRELTNVTTEMWAIRSLGHEILRGGKGGGYNWLREHLVTDYTPQWYEHYEQEEDVWGVGADAAILTSESDSRWYNYYIEGLAWMVKNLDIDGIYLDDVSFDRRILKRMRRAMETVKPGCLIDLHSNTAFSKGAANQYAEFFPYVDKLWFGESFLYDKMTPANWMVESSGIPFGLTGDMLYRGGNRWLGMQYGMTVRYPWFTEGVNCDPRPVWKIWDEFNIEDSKMLGFWENYPAVTSSDKDVKVTAYKKPGKALLSIGNYSDEVKEVTLNFDWEQLGLNPENITLVAPEVKDMQPASQWNINEGIRVEPRKGWLIYMIEK